VLVALHGDVAVRVPLGRPVVDLPLAVLWGGGDTGGQTGGHRRSRGRSYIY